MAYGKRSRLAQGRPRAILVAVLAAGAAGLAHDPPPAQAMPGVLHRIATCETGLVDGRLNWRYRSRSFATAFGIHRAAWQDYHRYVRGAPSDPERATPLEQVAVALAIYRHAGGGWHAWGCYRNNAWVRAGRGVVVTEGERRALRAEQRRRLAVRTASPSVVVLGQRQPGPPRRTPTFAEAIGRYTGHPPRTPWQPATAAGR